MRVEGIQVVDDPGHAAAVVHDDDAAGAGHGAALGHGVEVHGDVHDAEFTAVLELELFIGTQHFGGTAARDDGFQFAAGFETAAEDVDDFAHGDLTDFDFVVAGLLHIAADAEDAGAGVVRRAELGVFRAAHLDDVLHMAEGFHVVHDGRAHVEAERRREIGGLDARVGALAFEGFDEAGLLAADVGTGTAMHVDLAVEAGAEDVLAEEAFIMRLCDGLFQNLRREGEFFAHVDVGKLGTHSEAGNRHAFDQLMRILMHDVPVLEGAGFGFVRVADQIDWLGIRGRNEAPLYTGRETCTPTATQAAGFDLVGDGAAIHGERLFELLIPAIFQVTFDGRIVSDSVDVLEDQALFTRMGFFTGKILDGGGHGIQYPSVNKLGNWDL